MKKQQIILISSAVVLLCLIYFFGQTIPPKKSSAAAGMSQAVQDISFDSIMTAAKKSLTPSQQTKVSELESAVVRGDVKQQKLKVYHQLADFWKDSAHALLPYAYYSGEAAKLENSEKSLTFAAHFFLRGVRGQDDPALKRWMALESKGLFEKALALNPSNDSSRVGLGSCYLFGNISETPMQGIQMIREVADRDPENMYAQFMLALGGMMSGQLDKAIERLTTVANHQPENVEVIVMLAEAYERKGDKVNAIRYYEQGKKLLDNPDIISEIDKRIAQLKQ